MRADAYEEEWPIVSCAEDLRRATHRPRPANRATTHTEPVHLSSGERPVAQRMSCGVDWRKIEREGSLSPVNAACAHGGHGVPVSRPVQQSIDRVSPAQKVSPKAACSVFKACEGEGGSSSTSFLGTAEPGGRIGVEYPA
ncbi:hypothetical protein C8Q78DRAFT_190465 [Trametes maxima]|nr:hypothetical protein C8Q78DRAFT_190465 [Trametes maxima]